MSIYHPQLQHPKGMLTSQDFFPASWTTWFIVCRAPNVCWQCTLGRLDWHVPDCILAHVLHVTAGQIKVLKGGWWNKRKKVWCSRLGSNWDQLGSNWITEEARKALVPVLLCITHHLKSGVLVSLPTLFPPHVTARACARISKKWVIHIKIKSWLRPLGPTTPFFKKNRLKIIFFFLLCSWLAKPAFNTATFMSSCVWLAWLKWAGAGRSFLSLLTSLRCSPKRSANPRPVSPMYTVDGHLVHDRQ